MTFDEIKQAINDGSQVYWCNSSYQVIKDSTGYRIVHIDDKNDSISLTWQDTDQLNGEEHEFYSE